MSPRPPLTKLEAFVPQILLTIGMTGGQILPADLEIPNFSPKLKMCTPPLKMWTPPLKMC